MNDKQKHELIKTATLTAAAAGLTVAGLVTSSAGLLVCGFGLSIYNTVRCVKKMGEAIDEMVIPTIAFEEV